MNENDLQISEMMSKLVQDTQARVELDEMSGIQDQARRILDAWANNNTITFSKAKPTSKIAKQKTTQYKKLDAPMMVARRAPTNRPSVDPTLIMDARLEKVRQMKAQRLEREKEKEKPVQQKATRVLQPITNNIQVSQVDEEIKIHRAKVADKLKEKQNELELRRKKNQKFKVLDENVAISIANEEKIKKASEKKTKVNEFNNDPELEKNYYVLADIQSNHVMTSTFSHWVEKCKFKSNAYLKAAKFSDFTKISSAFSSWKNKYRHVVHEHEVAMLESELRKNKRNEEQADSIYHNNLIFKAVNKWKSSFKAVIELKVAEMQHKKRREILLQKIEAKVQEEEKNEVEVEIEQPKPKPKVQNKKITSLKTDIRFEAMAKRNEEIKSRRREKAQKEAQADQVIQNEKMKNQMEAQRKKRLEHKKFLEEEQKKRKEQIEKEEAFEKEVQRRKYLLKATEEFRIRRLQLNAIRSWEKIKQINQEHEYTATTHRQNHLMQIAFTTLNEFANHKNEKREKKGEKIYDDRIIHTTFLSWFACFQETKELATNVMDVSNKWKLKRVLRSMALEYLQRRKAKYLRACQFANRQLIGKCMRAWPIGCSLLTYEDEREAERANLMEKALDLLSQFDDADFE